MSPDDPVLRDDNIAKFAWYHTSTQPDWPRGAFDPTTELTEQARQMMGGERSVARWAEQQRAKALHVGTYESAVHNMLRRISDQADHGRQFYLYRLYLAPAISVREGWLVDPSNWVGDVVLAEVCPPGIDVARYLNYHEDPGGLSLALGRTAIASTQQIAIPRLSNDDSGWIAIAVAALETASVKSPPSAGPRSSGKFRALSPRTETGRSLAASLAERLPANLRGQFEAAAAFDDSLEPQEWAQYVKGLANMILSPAQVLAELDEAKTVRCV